MATLSLPSPSPHKRRITKGVDEIEFWGMRRMRRKSEGKKWWWDDTESVKGETEDISYIWQFLEVGNCEVGSWSKLCRRRRLWSAGDHTALLARWSHLVITQGAALITQRRWWWSEAPSAEVALTLLSSSVPKPLLVRPFGYWEENQCFSVLMPFSVHPRFIRYSPRVMLVKSIPIIHIMW